MIRTILCITAAVAWPAIWNVGGQSINRGYGLNINTDSDPGRWPKLEQIGEIHPALPKTKLLSAAESYFEVAKGARVGDEVVGRVNLANNSFEPVEFSITGGTGRSLFRIESFVNSRGKHFGVIKLKSARLKGDSHTLRVKGKFTGGTSDEQLYTIRSVDEPLAERFLQLKEREFTQHRRLSSSAPDKQIQTILSLMKKDGSFKDLPMGMKKKGWENTCESAERLLKLATSYLDKDSRFFKDKKLKAALYSGVISNAKQNARYRTNWAETHVWRNSDFIAGIGIRFFRTLREEMGSSDVSVSKKAIEVYDAILDVCDVMWAERMYERPAIGNANRNHRMRSLITRAAISYDYNRALTDEDVWYDTVDPRVPGYYPNGVYGDVMELIETGFVFMDTYNNRNGFFPDGTICHHPRVGLQFTADAYGWQWLVENSIPMADFLKDTRYRATDSMYNIIADRLLDAYRPLTYNGYLDMSVGGLLPDRSKWGPQLLKAVSGLLEAKSKDTTIKREAELREYSAILEENSYVDELSLNQPFWNIDLLVHRRPDYFASAKMISIRSRGLERGVDRRSYYYLGDGALFVRVNNDDYNGLSDDYNWHAIPGTTAEQRLDALPLAADSPFRGANGTNRFAGVVSDGRYGFGAFVYERNHPDDSVNYSTVNANKGYFFFEDEIVALGNSIRRVRPGDDQEIWTTLEQKALKSDIQYRVGNSRRETISASSSEGTREFYDIRKPAYFFQDRVGYVIFPGRESVDLRLSIETASKSRKLFQLGINHGKQPRGESYRYIVLPNTSLKEVTRFVEDWSTDPPIIILQNEESIMAVQHTALKLAQIAFYQAGQITIPSLLKDPIRLSVDRPALIMLSMKDSDLDLTVTDPNHSTTEASIALTIDRKLSGPHCVYDSTQMISRIAFTHSTEEVYAGKPVSARYRYVR